MANPGTPIWPTTLPQEPLVQGAREVLANNKVVSRTESGNTKKRRRFTSAPSTQNYTVFLDVDQANTLADFYEETTGFGSINFEWRNPRTGRFHLFSFESPPSFTWAGPFNLTCALNIQQRTGTA